MTLKTISGYRNTKEAAGIAGEIEFRAKGAEIFAKEPAAPKVSTTSVPVV